MPAPSRHPNRGTWSLHAKIDVCRGLFAWMVAIAHALGVVWALRPGDRAALSPAVKGVIECTLGAGFCWVMGFFILSGFCIHRSVERRLASGAFPLRGYLLARSSRILPLYYAALGFTLAVEWLVRGARPGIWEHGIDGETLAAQLLVVQGVRECFGSFTPSWSITNELFYYVAYGVLAHLAAIRGAWSAWVGMAGSVALGLTFQTLYLSGLRSPWILSVGFLLGLGSVWFLGVLIAVERERLSSRSVLTEAARAWPLILVAAAVLFGRDVPFQLIDPICGVAFALMLVRFLATTPPADGPEPVGRVPRLMGLSSYPTYLFHAPWMMAIGSIMIRVGWSGDWRLTWLLLSASSIGLGLLLGWFVERPLLAWRSRLMARASRAPAMPSHPTTKALGAAR